MEGFSFVTPVTGLNRPNTGKENDDENLLKKSFFADYIRVSCQEKQYGAKLVAFVSKVKETLEERKKNINFATRHQKHDKFSVLCRRYTASSLGIPDFRNVKPAVFSIAGGRAKYGSTKGICRKKVMIIIWLYSPIRALASPYGVS
jgi:hypothetical protein